jgi:hypothetical protein
MMFSGRIRIASNKMAALTRASLRIEHHQCHYGERDYGLHPAEKPDIHEHAKSEIRGRSNGHGRSDPMLYNYERG